MIKKLKGEKMQKEEKVKLYNEEGEELEEERYEEQIRGFWQRIYQMHGNDIEREWGKKKERPTREPATPGRRPRSYRPGPTSGSGARRCSRRPHRAEIAGPR